MTIQIAFTGGGTAGHVTPNFPLIEAAQQEGWKIYYIGSQDGVEKDMIEGRGIAFYPISTGKLRRYFSWQNFLDPFRIVKGIIQAYRLLGCCNIQIVFSKGGFVTVPVVIAAWLRKIPVIAHESDMTPGLANRLSFPFVNKICVNFAPTKSHFKNQDKVIVTGTPIRATLFQGSQEKGLVLCGFTSDKPRLLVMGGSLGSQHLNHIIRSHLVELTQDYYIIHLCGKGKLDMSLQEHPSYRQWEFANEELADLLAASDIVVSRAGANTLCEILALQKLHILIPLSAKVSRGDQIQNARYFTELGISQVIWEESLTLAHLKEALRRVNQERTIIYDKMKILGVQSATAGIMNLIKDEIHDRCAKIV